MKTEHIGAHEYRPTRREKRWEEGSRRDDRNTYLIWGCMALLAALWTWLLVTHGVEWGMI